MIIIGFDLHTRLQQVAMFDPTTGSAHLDLLLMSRFPRIWMPSLAERDLRQLLRHRHKLVCYRTSVMNQLQGLAINQRLCRRRKL